MTMLYYLGGKKFGFKQFSKSGRYGGMGAQQGDVRILLVFDSRHGKGKTKRDIEKNKEELKRLKEFLDGIDFPSCL
ncbi:MAG: hypothetical protein U9N81_04350 [Bacillota bacterium]|nr:hypothetical protein [Bacillota bacterium]